MMGVRANESMINTTTISQKGCQWAKFPFPISLKVFNFGVELQFCHGFKFLENSEGFSFAFKKINPSESRKNINKSNVV